MNKRELILLYLFITIFFIITAVISKNITEAKKEKTNNKYTNLDLKWLEIQETIKNKRQINNTKSWILKNITEFKNEKEADQNIFKFVGKSIQNNKISILTQKLLEQEDQQHAIISGINLKIEGLYENIIKWLYEIQGDKNFIVIKNFTLKPNKKEEKNKLICEIVLQKFFYKKK